MASDDTHERRRHQRSWASIPAWVASDGVRIDASTRNISIGGVQVEAKAKVKKGEVVEMAISVPGRTEPLALKGTVAWTRDDVMGVQFVDLDKETEAVLQVMVHGELGLDDDVGYPEDEPTQDL